MKRDLSSSPFPTANNVIVDRSDFWVPKEPSKVQDYLDNSVVDIVLEVSERLEAVAFDEIRTTSGAPLDVLHIYHDDDSSQVSVITPLSASGTSCYLIHAMGEKRVSSESNKREDFSFVAEAANYVWDTMSAVMEDMAVSIDPDVLEECQDRTRSMLSKSWGAAFDDLTSPRLARIPSSIFTDDKEEITQKDVKTSFSSYGAKKEIICSQPKQVTAQQSVTSLSRRLPSSRHGQCEGSSTATKQHKDIEVTEEEGIVDCGQLGKEIEITIHENELVLYSTEMTTEVVPSSVFPSPSANLCDDCNVGIVVHNLHEHERRFMQRWKFRSHMFRRKARKQERRKSPGKVAFKVNKTSQRVGSKGSGKTVSTAFSDESSTTVHTEETRWIQDADVLRILEGK